MVAKEFETAIDELGRRQGVDRAEERMTAVVLGCVAKYQTTLRRRALKSGRQLFASTPSAFRTQIDKWWRKARARST